MMDFYWQLHCFSPINQMQDSMLDTLLGLHICFFTAGPTHRRNSLALGSSCDNVSVLVDLVHSCHVPRLEVAN